MVKWFGSIERKRILMLKEGEILARAKKLKLLN
jgi:hypothetical protein